MTDLDWILDSWHERTGSIKGYEKEKKETMTNINQYIYHQIEELVGEPETVALDVESVEAGLIEINTRRKYRQEILDKAQRVFMGAKPNSNKTDKEKL